MLNVKSSAIPELGFQGVLDLLQSSPPTWESSIVNNILIFMVGSPILVTGLSLSGIAAAFLLGTLTWRAFGPSGFLLVASYFVIGTAATKVKIAQKEAQGVAEKRKGRRGPSSVIGSSAAGCVCAFLSIYNVGGAAFSGHWVLGFVASFCTKLSDTVSSEVGKAYGKTTYLVTTFKVVPRGTEGAVSVEGTVAGLLASILLASVSCIMGELNNDVVNVINISLGSILAVLMKQFLFSELASVSKQFGQNSSMIDLVPSSKVQVSDLLTVVSAQLQSLSEEDRITEKMH